VEIGETPAYAATREVHEELGIEAAVGPLLVADWAPHPDEGDKLLLVFDGGTLTAEQLDAIQLHADELASYAFRDPTEAIPVLIPRLARRVAAAIDAHQTGRTTYLEIKLTDEQLDTLHEAGCDDGSFSVEPDGTVLDFFDREAPTEQDAVISAIVNIERAGIGARVLRVQADDDPPSPASVHRTHSGAGPRSRHGSSAMNLKPCQHTGRGSPLTSSPRSMIGLTCGSVFDTRLMPHGGQS
jgi:ADP-ribose pyrophosphatase YjhB (NUDIX family)